MNFRYIDTHAHLNIGVFTDDREAVVQSCVDKEVAVINVGTKLTTSKTAVEIADKTASAGANCYAIVGLHPIQTTGADHDEDEIGPGGEPFVSKGESFDREAFDALAQHPKVVGVGECGFDFYRCDADTYETQEREFIAQIEFANERQLPLMIHTRDSKGNQASANPNGRSAYDDVYDVLKQYAKVPGNIHFYAGSYEQANKFFDIGFTVSFTGVITFAQDYEETVKSAPLDMMHAETDCPYVAPAPYRGQRSEPAMVVEVYKKIAALKGLDEETVRLQLLENAHRLYKL